MTYPGGAGRVPNDAQRLAALAGMVNANIQVSMDIHAMMGQLIEVVDHLGARVEDDSLHEWLRVSSYQLRAAHGASLANVKALVAQTMSQFGPYR